MRERGREEVACGAGRSSSLQDEVQEEDEWEAITTACSIGTVVWASQPESFPLGYKTVLCSSKGRRMKFLKQQVLSC